METTNDRIDFGNENNSFNKITAYLTKTGSGYISLCVLLLRCVIGIILFDVGAGKLFGWFGGFGLDVTLGFYAKMGFSQPLAFMSIFTEFIGGFLLTVGFLTRPAALAVIINMAVATYVSLPGGFLGPNGASYPFVFLVIALAVLLSGPMYLSIDYLIFGKTKSYY